MSSAPFDPSGSSPRTSVEKLAAIKREVADAAQVAGRDSMIGPVTVTAVSKKHPAETILPVLQHGHRIFGENRVQEAMGKWPSLCEQFPDIQLRLIGPLQTNKAKEAVQLFDVIETLDRPKLARSLANEIQMQGKAPVLCVQINTGEEPQKSGIIPEEADAFIKSCREEYDLPVAGLMCIPPVEAVAAPHFALLRKIAERNDLMVLSMGMSGDYLTAVKLGATHIRIGTGIFGARVD